MLQAHHFFTEYIYFRVIVVIRGHLLGPGNMTGKVSPSNKGTAGVRLEQGEGRQRAGASWKQRDLIQRVTLSMRVKKKRNAAKRKKLRQVSLEAVC